MPSRSIKQPGIRLGVFVFGSTIPLKTLADLSRSMATMLHAGLPIVKVVSSVATRFGSMTTKRHMKDVSERLKMGYDVRSAFDAQSGYFPDLFVDMVSVAEETGSLPEVLKSLADHYESLLKMRREFLGQIALPVLQLIAAICIITLVILIMGMIASSKGGKSYDVFGWGLTGTAGAATFFFGCISIFVAITLGYYLIIVGFKQQRIIHTILLGVPVLGPCMRSFAIARFSWAFALTQKAGMRIVPSLEAALKATANYAFIGASRQMCGLVKQGEDLSMAMMDSRLFPVEFEQMVEVAEQSGTVPEMLDHLSPQFDESARRSLRVLTTMIAWLVWAIVAGFIIFAIFSLFSFYLKAINNPEDL